MHDRRKGLGGAKHGQIGAALIRRGDDILLVRQTDPLAGVSSWSLPGGQVEPGELPHEAMIREVLEETGLQVLDPGRLLYANAGVDPGTGVRGTAWVFEVRAWRGQLQTRPDDPEDPVTEARFFSLEEATRRLEELPRPGMRDPILAHLRGEMEPGALWLYHYGSHGSDDLVACLSGSTGATPGDEKDPIIPAIPALYTERLVLRPFEPADAPRVRELASAPEVAETTLNIPHPYPAGAAEAWLSTHAESAAAGRAYTWAVTLNSSGEVAGAITIRVNADHGRADLGYWLGVEYWNKGYMTEAVRRVVEWGFGELRLHRVEARCLPRNRGSSRVMEKAGMCHEGTLRGYIRKGDRYEDIAVYGLLHEDLADERRR